MIIKHAGGPDLNLITVFRIINSLMELGGGGGGGGTRLSRVDYNCLPLVKSQGWDVLLFIPKAPIMTDAYLLCSPSQIEWTSVCYYCTYINFGFCSTTNISVTNNYQTIEIADEFQFF